MSSLTPPPRYRQQALPPSNAMPYDYRDADSRVRAFQQQPSSQPQHQEVAYWGGASKRPNTALTGFGNGPRPQHRTIPYPVSGPVGLDTEATGNNGTVWNPLSYGQEEEIDDTKWRRQTRSIAHYRRIEQIGEGTYGQVYKAHCLQTGRLVALKKIRLHHGGYWGMPPTVIREVKILKALRHRNMVEMIEVVSSKGYEHLDKEDEREEEKRKRLKEEQANADSLSRGTKDSDIVKHSNSVTKKSHKKDRILDAREGYKGNLFLVLEYVSHDLTGLMDMRYKFTDVQVKCIFRQLLDVLSYIHENKYVHRDLKSSNILIDPHFRVKLADFGLARCIAPPIFDNTTDDRMSGSSLDFTNKVITLWYRPPELLLGATRYGASVDIWSAGCILAELLLGKPLFTGKNEMDQLKLVFDMMGTPTNSSWEGFSDLKLIRTGEVEINKQRAPKLRDKYKEKISQPALALIEKLLELDPQKRLTASRALDSRYFYSNPVAPENPEDLGVIMLDGDSHEFQTKQIRREAKSVAQKASTEAKNKGLDEKEAYDSAYQMHLQKCAETRAMGETNPDAHIAGYPDNMDPANSRDLAKRDRSGKERKRDRDENKTKDRDYDRKRHRDSKDREKERSPASRDKHKELSSSYRDSKERTERRKDRRENKDKDKDRSPSSRDKYRDSTSRREPKDREKDGSLSRESKYKDSGSRRESRDRENRDRDSKDKSKTSSKDRPRDSRSHREKETVRQDLADTETSKSDTLEPKKDYEHSKASKKSELEKLSLELAAAENGNDRKNVPSDEKEGNLKQIIYQDSNSINKSGGESLRKKDENTQKPQDKPSERSEKKSTPKELHREHGRRRSRSKDRSRSRERNRDRRNRGSSKDRSSKESRRRHGRSDRRERDSSSKSKSDRKSSSQREWEKQVEEEIAREQGQQNRRGRDSDRHSREYGRDMDRSRIHRSRSRERARRSDERGGDMMGERWMGPQGYHPRDDGYYPRDDGYHPRDGQPSNFFYPPDHRGFGRGFGHGPPMPPPRYGPRGEGPYREPERDRYPRDQHERERYRERRPTR